MDETSNPDTSWYATPSATLKQSKRKHDDVSPREETRPRQDREDKRRRRMDAKRQKSKPVVIEEKIEVPVPKSPLAAVSVQNDIPQVLEEELPPPSTNISRTSPYEEPQVSGSAVDLQAGFRAEGVSLLETIFLKGNPPDLY